jgi:RNA polymerase sigma-70 factor, ECF subfamily
MDLATAPPPETHDVRLLARLRARDEAAFVELVTRLNGPLLRLAMTHVSSRGVAEEVVQETWLAVLDGLDRFEGRSSLKTWIFRILTNRAKTRGVRERRAVPFSSLTTAADDDDDLTVEHSAFESSVWATPASSWPDTGAEQWLLTEEVMARIEAVVPTLPAPQRRVFVLRDLEGLDAEATCDLLHIKAPHQRVLLHRARSRVRAALDDVVKRCAA